MHSFFFGLLVGMIMVCAAPNARAADLINFEVMGLKLGMTVSETEAAAQRSKFTIAGRDRGPSFGQAIAQKRGQRVSGTAYTAVNKLNLVRDDARVEVFFVPTANGPRSYQIAANIISVKDGADLADEVVAKYGEPEQRNQREWLWGDTGMFYARSKVFLEFQPNPVSATAPKPVGRLILADPSLQKHSQEAVASEAQKGS